tara:strand:+ start:343 stop:555 length:213 start_codon:yes stop_codon:yes gene_type:complete
MNYDRTLRQGDRIEVYTAANEWRMATVIKVERDEVTAAVDGRVSHRSFAWFSIRRPVGLTEKRLPLTADR